MRSAAELRMIEKDEKTLLINDDFTENSIIETCGMKKNHE